MLRGRDRGTLEGMDTLAAPVSSAPPPPCSPGSRRARVMRCGTCLHRFQPGRPAGGRRVHRQRRRDAEAGAAGNDYLIQDIAAQTPLRPDLEAGFWYFATASGQAGLRAKVRGIAEVIWRRNSPSWTFDDATLDQAAEAFDNPDYVDIVIQSGRHRLGHGVVDESAARPKAPGPGDESAMSIIRSGGALTGPKLSTYLVATGEPVATLTTPP